MCNCVIKSHRKKFFMNYFGCNSINNSDNSNYHLCIPNSNLKYFKQSKQTFPRKQTSIVIKQRMLIFNIDC